jgi:phosphatidylglycerol:prolipoprotein diacylglycerol transferase
MLQTLFYMPWQIGGIPVFGFGLLLAAWVGFSVILLVWLAWRQGFNADTWAYVPLLVLIGTIIWFVLPRLCEPKGLPIRGYGVMLLVAVAAATGLAARRARQFGIDPEIVFGLALWAFVPGIIGARLWYVIQYWPAFDRPTVGATLAEIVNVAQGGLVVYGSLIGAFVGLLIYITRHNLPLLATFDLIAPSLMLGMAIGRVGCLLNGCCYGGICDLPWAVRFPAGSPAHVHQMKEGEAFFHGLTIEDGRQGAAIIDQVEPGSPAQRQGLKSGQRIVSINGREVHTSQQAREELIRAHETGPEEVSVVVQPDQKVYSWPVSGPPRSEPVHPTQIYAAINSLILCLLLLAYDPFRRRDGQLWAMFLTLYPITRFLLEAIRDDEPAMGLFELTRSQYFSLILLACAVALWIYLLRKPPGTAFPTWRQVNGRT